MVRQIRAPLLLSLSLLFLLLEWTCAQDESTPSTPSPGGSPALVKGLVREYHYLCSKPLSLRACADDGLHVTDHVVLQSL